MSDTRPCWYMQYVKVQDGTYTASMQERWYSGVLLGWGLECPEPGSIHSVAIIESTRKEEHLRGRCVTVPPSYVTFNSIPPGPRG